MIGVFLALTYAALFIFLVWKIKFFQTELVSRKFIVIAFILKIISGTVLWFVYTHIYIDRFSADIFKYFDYGKIMYNTLFFKPLDYFKMLFGFQDSSLLHYYNDDMRNWTRAF